MNELKGMPLLIASHALSWIDVPKHICTTVYFSGCNLGCKGCHNEELQGITSTPRSMKDIYAACNCLLTDYICLMGGEPLYQDNDKLRDFIKCIKCKTKKQVCMYTGYSFNEIPKKILEHLDMVKVGRYGETQYYFERQGKEWVEMEEKRREI